MTVPSPGTLARRIEDWYAGMQWMRKMRLDNVSEFAGQWYGNSPRPIRRISNMIYEGVQTIRPMLVPDQVSARVKARFPVMDFEADSFKMRLDDRIRECGLEEQIGLAIDDALFGGLGIICVGETQSDDSAVIDQREYWLGETFARAIDPDDFVMDTDARTDSELRCIGYKVRINRYTATKKGLYGRDPEELGNVPPEIQALCMTRAEAKEALEGAPQLSATPTEYMTSQLAGANNATRLTVNELIEVWELVYYCETGPYRIVMIARGDRAVMNGDKFLICEPYDGPEKTGFHFLAPVAVRGNVIGLAYASSIRDLHVAGVNVSEKVTDGILSAKRDLVAQREEADTVQSMIDSPSGSVHLVGNANAIQSVELGGAPSGTMEGVAWLDGQFQKVGGNTSLLGGTGGTAKTATASSILNAGAQSRMSEMGRIVKQFVTGIVRSIAWYEWFNPLAEWQHSMETPAGAIDYTFPAYLREGDNLDQLFDIQVDTISIQQAEPAVRQQQFAMFFQGVLLPSMPLVLQGIFSMQGLISIGKNLYGCREMDQLVPDVQRMEQQMQLMQQMQQQPMQAQPTNTRNPNQATPPQQPQMGQPSMAPPMMSDTPPGQSMPPRIGMTAAAYS